MSAPDFVEFPKIGRWYRPICITEKIDGANCAIDIQVGQKDPRDPTILFGEVLPHVMVTEELGATQQGHLIVRAASRKRWLTLKDDCDGFAAWVAANAAELVKLGEGHHFGEWFGYKIGRGYDLPGRRFALFNVSRWVPGIGGWDGAHDVKREGRPFVAAPGLGVVPVLYRGPMRHNETDFSPATDAVQEAIRRLRAGGSNAVRGFMRPEGIMIYHEALQVYGKFTLDGDAHKG